MYEKCGMRIKAAEEAVRIKDAEAVDRLREAAGVGTVEGREVSFFYLSSLLFDERELRFFEILLSFWLSRRLYSGDYMLIGF